MSPNIRDEFVDPPLRGVWDDEYPSEYNKDEVRKVIREEITEALTNVSIAGLLVDNTIPQSKLIAGFKQPVHLIGVGMVGGVVDGAYRDYSTAPYIGFHPTVLEETGYTQMRIKWTLHLSALNGCTVLNIQLGANHVFVGNVVIAGYTVTPPVVSFSRYDSGWIKIPSGLLAAYHFCAPTYAYNTAGGNPTIGFNFFSMWVR